MRQDPQRWVVHVLLDLQKRMSRGANMMVEGVKNGRRKLKSNLEKFQEIYSNQCGHSE